MSEQNSVLNATDLTMQTEMNDRQSSQHKEDVLSENSFPN